MRLIYVSQISAIKRFEEIVEIGEHVIEIDNWIKISQKDAIGKSWILVYGCGVWIEYSLDRLNEILMAVARRKIDSYLSVL